MTEPLNLGEMHGLFSFSFSNIYSGSVDLDPKIGALYLQVIEYDGNDFWGTYRVEHYPMVTSNGLIHPKDFGQLNLAGHPISVSWNKWV